MSEPAKKILNKNLVGRVCPLCNRVIPERDGVYHADLGILVCQGACSERVDSSRRIYDRSAKGRWRPRREVLRELGLR